jgi:hypothetical protein
MNHFACLFVKLIKCVHNVILFTSQVHFLKLITKRDSHKYLLSAKKKNFEGDLNCNLSFKVINFAVSDKKKQEKSSSSSHGPA